MHLQHAHAQTHTAARQEQQRAPPNHQRRSHRPAAINLSWHHAESGVPAQTESAGAAQRHARACGGGTLAPSAWEGGGEAALCAPVCNEETCLSRCGDLALCWRRLGAAEGWVIFDTKRAGVGMGTGLYYQHKGCLSCTRVFFPILRLLGVRVPGTSKDADQVVCLLYAAARLEEFASGHLANRS